mmetsp:Transcript_30635/g.45341  ORF Transcript_30635/g.45341 Transcript_30635/m.45341 type:complete len:320 (+) Transcript_30635:89-1048(+)|eukprot:CAMPEP_0195523722 /NCGR_PEP_ID=MMETSP0794_2-20130614/23069_1 /TAXON_ID=515487 /ORGANISM="Stephanopyxis turris, Strain CCMP 815" /LENGTH=319 /DNA_ID=CAMNT_0040653781 /DNA_START=84 /DNA_END=1043 /DNA_ORIENTATION=+
MKCSAAIRLSCMGLSLNFAITTTNDTNIRLVDSAEKMQQTYRLSSSPFGDDASRKLFYWATCKGRTLEGGERLHRGDCLCSNNDYFMCMGNYGYLELNSDVRGEGYNFWKANGERGDYAQMQQDGNLVVYKNKNNGGVKDVWSSNTDGNKNAKLKLDKQGVATIVSHEESILWTEYERGCKWVHLRKNNEFLLKGERLFRGQFICRNYYRFGIDDEGDIVVLYRDDSYYGDDDKYFNDYHDDWEDTEQKVVWRTGTSAKGGLFLKMKSNGNLKVYNDDNESVWSSKTGGNFGAKVKIEENGYVSIVDEDGFEVWDIGPF